MLEKEGATVAFMHFFSNFVMLKVILSIWNLFFLQ